MWEKVESSVMPSNVDTTSSNVYVYVNRNITEKIVEDETIYEYETMKIKKEDYPLWVAQIETQDALIELAGIISGGI